VSPPSPTAGSPSAEGTGQEEIANMCVYLASPLASATTGAALRVDGGYVDAILP
jgi:enoyl-[acyl-carrier-protein] reductase (NADH)